MESGFPQLKSPEWKEGWFWLVPGLQLHSLAHKGG